MNSIENRESMSEDIKTTINSQGEGDKVLLGLFANTISMATGIFSVEDRIGPESLSFRVERYSPTHYVSIGEMEAEIREVLDPGYDIFLIKTYDVFNNYYTGEPVFFYELVRRE